MHRQLITLTKMRKFNISIISLLLLTFLPLKSGAAIVTHDYLLYDVDQTTLTASVVGVSADYARYTTGVFIPAEIEIGYNKYAVTSIKSEAFMDNDVLLNVFIPESVTAIGERAFKRCTKLSIVNVPTHITSIESETFANCDSLKSIVLPDSLENIGFGAFEFCKALASVSVGNHLVTIGSWAFNGCLSLQPLRCSDHNCYSGKSEYHRRLCFQRMPRS